MCHSNAHSLIFAGHGTARISENALFENALYRSSKPQQVCTYDGVNHHEVTRTGMGHDFLSIVAKKNLVTY